MSRVSKIAVSAMAGGLMLGIAPQAGAILYAEDATSPLAASTALIITDDDKYCTGTVIDAETIISADHCFSDSETGVAVIGGTTDHDQAETIQFSSVDVYPGPEDVALVNLDAETTAPAVEIYDGPDALAGTEGTILGWGGEYIEGVGPFDAIQQDEGIQREGRFEVSPRNDQDSIGFDLVTGAITPGDSGGPVFVDGKLYGILSMYSPPEPVEGEPNTGWYSAVADYADWILDPTDPTDPVPEPTPEPTDPTPEPTPDPTDPTDPTPEPTDPTPEPTVDPEPVVPAPPAEVPVGDVPVNQAPLTLVSDYTEYGPKVETGGQVNQSWMSKVASIFR